VPSHFRIFETVGAEDYAHEELGKRLKVAKPAELVEIPGTKVAAEYAARARELARFEGIRQVLIVVNRVDLARAIFEEFRGENALLLTGRVREIDREEIVKKIKHALTEEGRELSLPFGRIGASPCGFRY
jgi:CRISPR/Cas system-associated endonuclease/helicase Cas3